MVGWHHRLNRHELEQTQEDSEGEGSLPCFSLWGREELNTTERLKSSCVVTLFCGTSYVNRDGFHISHMKWVLYH